MLTPEDNEGTRHVATGKWGRKNVEFLEGRVIIKFKTPRGDADQASVAHTCAVVISETEGAEVARPPGENGRALLTVGDGDVITTAKALNARSDVEYAEPDVIDHAAVIPSDPRYADQWGYAKVNAPGAWDLETGKSTVLIGIIDSGISMSTGGALDHPDLSDASRITLGTDFVDGGTPRDLNGHGTHVAGTAAASSNNGTGVSGMNWGSPLYICRTLDTAGNGSSADLADAIEEITDYAVANNLKAVINYSGGGGANQTKLDACNYASSRGMIICAAAGNDNGGPVIWPAAYSTTVPGVIAVGSTTSTDAVSSFSNHGPEVTVVAPGSSIMSTMPTYSVTIPRNVNYDYLDGTSMACPLVTGLAALMWSRNTSKTNAAIKQCLIDTAVKLGAGSFDNSWGNGRVDARAALECVRPIVSVPLTRIIVTCNASRLTVACAATRVGCVPVTKLGCAVTRLTPCKVSRLPVLCPVKTSLHSPCATESTLQVCVSTRLAACLATRLASCGQSRIDACPSALACPDTVINPGSTVINAGVIRDPRVTGPIGRFRADAGVADAGYVYAGDEGTLHAWSPEPTSDEELWSEGDAEYYWIDDAGNAHLWESGTAGQ